MTKPALAAVVALAMSLPLASLSAKAQGSSASTSSESKAQNSAPAVQTTFSAPQQANRTRATQVGAAPTTWRTYNTRGTTQTTAATTTTAATKGATTAPATKVDDTVVVTSGNTRTAEGTGKAPAWQKYYEYIKLKQNQDAIPLTLVVTNGAPPDHPAFQAVRIFLAGQQLATEKDFKGNVLQLKMDGTITAGGDNQVIIQAFGVPGSQISWKLTTQRAVVTSVKPDTAELGQSITISGRNFSNKKGVTQVWIGEKLATITSGNAKTLVATIPPTAVNGVNNLNVAVAGVPAKPLKITIKAAPPPVLSSTDLYGCPPGTTVSLSGKGFSNKVGENVVTVGGIQASIIDFNETLIHFSMPEVPNEWTPIPVIVKTRGVASNSINMQGSNRLLPNQYQTP